MEYSLLICLVALAAVGLLGGVGRTTARSWNVLNAQLTTALSIAAPAPPAAPHGNPGHEDGGDDD